MKLGSQPLLLEVRKELIPPALVACGHIVSLQLYVNALEFSFFRIGTPQAGQSSSKDVQCALWEGD